MYRETSITLVDYYRKLIRDVGNHPTSLLKCSMLIWYVVNANKDLLVSGYLQARKSDDFL